MTAMLGGVELVFEGKHEREDAIQSLIIEYSTKAKTNPQA
jgi:hypothetical protein